MQTTQQKEDLYNLIFLPGRDNRAVGDKQFAKLYIRLITHILLLGRTGSGKTTVMLRMLRAALKADMGFIFLSFHHPPCRDATALAATYGYKPEDVIVVYPKIADEIGAAVKINPFDLPDTMAATFVDMMKQMSTAWGPRMEPIFIQLVRSVMNLDPQYRNISGAYTFADDPSVRQEQLVPRLTNDELKSYWNRTFNEKYGKNAEEALSPILSRLLRIMANFHARATFDVRLGDKKLDFVDIIRNRRKVIIDLSDIDDSTKEFISAIIMLLVHSAVMQLKEREESEKDPTVMPFLLMIDEVQHMASVLRELLNVYRKYNVKMIMSTQAADGLGKDVYNAIMEITSTVIGFAMGSMTYKLVDDVMLLDKETMANMESYKFCLYTKQGLAGSPVNGKGVYETTPVQYLPEFDPETPTGKANIEQFTKASIKIHGSEVDVNTLLPPSAENLGRMEIPFSFKEYAVMCWLFNNGGTHPTSTVYNTVAKMFRLDASSVLKGGIERLLRRPGKFYLSESLDAEDGRMVSLTAGAADELFIGDIPVGQRGGGEWHVSVIGRIAKYYRSIYHYVQVDMGGGNIQKPDVLVVPYYAVTRVNKETDEEEVVDILWHHDDAQAWEVESGHILGKKEQVKENLVKNERARRFTNFVVENEHERKALIEFFVNECGISTDRFKCWIESELPEAKHYGIGLSSPDIEPEKPKVVEQVRENPGEKQVLVQEGDEIQQIKNAAKPFIARLKKNGDDKEAMNELLAQGYTVSEQDGMFRIKRYLGGKAVDDKNFKIKRAGKK